MPKAANIDFAILYPIAFICLVLALLPIYVFGVEALFTSFNQSWGLISTIASYYENNMAEDNDSGVLIFIHKFLIPFFAGVSANKTWRTKYKKIRISSFVYVIIAIVLILFCYEWVLSIEEVEERLGMFNISTQSLNAYFESQKDPLYTLLGAMIGLELFQKNKDAREE